MTYCGISVMNPGSIMVDRTMMKRGPRPLNSILANPYAMYALTKTLASTTMTVMTAVLMKYVPNGATVNISVKFENWMSSGMKVNSPRYISSIVFSEMEIIQNSGAIMKRLPASRSTKLKARQNFIFPLLYMSIPLVMDPAFG